MSQTYQSGCLRVRMPTPEGAASPCAVLINVGGGLTGGDRLSQSVAWDEGAEAAVTTQAAEKIYKSAGGQVEIDTRLTVAAGARAEWLPQETILFDRARMDRRLSVDMAADARFLGIESMVLGRAAMGETVKDAGLRDSWRIVRGGRLIYADVQALQGGRIDSLMDRAAVGAGARAMAVIVCVGEHSAALLEPLRRVLDGATGRAAASAWNGMLVARFLAPDGQALKGDLSCALSVLRADRPLPRVWSC